MKKKGKLKLALIILIIISALVGIYIGVCKQKNISMINVFQNLRRLPEDLEGWNLSLLMYDSAVDNGMSAVNNDVWDATNYNEKRVVTVQVNLSNTALAKDYEPGELVITVDSLGKINPLNNQMTNIKSPTTISADLYSKEDKDYDWSYRFDSESQKFVFTNNNLIEFGTTFESTIQMAFEFSAPDVLNGADVTIDANLNGELSSINTLNYKFTSNKRSGTNSLTFSKLNSYDGLGQNATDYYWVEFSISSYMQGFNVRAGLFDSYVDFTVPEGCILYKSNMTPILPDENSIYKLLNNLSGSYSINKYYICFPKEIYENQTINLTENWYGKYRDSSYVNGDPNKELELIASNTKSLNVSEYEIVYNGNLYNVSKSSVNSNKVTYNKIVNENLGESISYRITGSTIYTGTIYKARYGDDTLYISNTEGGYTKLNDDEYYFKNVTMPSDFYNGNSQKIEREKYNIDLYVRYRGTSSYVKYGETLKSGINQTITFNTNEYVVGWYVEIYDLEESIIFSAGYANRYFKTDVYIQKSQGIPEVGKIYNFDYLQVYNKNENEYVLVNEPEITLYDNINGNNINTIKGELAESDIANYGVYLQRGFYYKDYGKDYEEYYMDIGNVKNSYDNNYFYHTIRMNPRLESTSTGTEAYDGYNSYLILPEGTELDATKDELYDLINQYYSSTLFIQNTYKADGTQFTQSEVLAFLKEHLTITIDTNYKDTGKTWIWFKVDFSETTLNTYKTGGNGTYIPMTYNVPIKIPYESYFTHGSRYSLLWYIAPLKDEGTYDYNKTRDTNDVDNDGDTTDYYSYTRTHSITIVPAVSSYQEASKNVWTETSENRYVSEFAVAKNGGIYKYKLKVRTGSNEITNLMIYDNLENASNDWKGTFVGIDTSFTNSQGFNPTLYVSDDRNAGTLEEDATNWRLYDSSADNSEVKSVAIEYGSAVIPAGFLTFVEVEMKAPEDPNIKTLAKNITYTKWNAIDLNGNIIDNVEGVTGNTVNVGLGKTEHDIVVQKVWNDNDDEHHVRPSSIVVHLLRNNVEINQVELNEINNWTHTFNNLQIYDDEYKKYEYTIIESPVNLYTPSVQYEELVVDSMSRTFTITNTINEDELFKDIVGSKTWDDNNNSRGRRPSNVTIDLYRDGTKIDSTTTNESNNWLFSFKNLPKWRDNTNEYVYSIQEIEDIHYSVDYNIDANKTNALKLKFNDQSRTHSVTNDYVEIYYEKDGIIYKVGKYGGTSIANQEIIIPSKDFYLYWKTNGTYNNYYGFKIDEILPIYLETGGIGTVSTLPEYTQEELTNDDYPESAHTYGANINQLWHYTYNSSNKYDYRQMNNTYKLIPSTVLVHHYIKDTTTSLVPDETIDGLVWDSYTTSPSSGIPTYYKLVAMPSNATGEFAATQTVVTYYYELKDYPYRVEYYYDGIIDSSKTETDADTYGVSINTYDDKVIEGYRFDHDSGKPLVITENEDTNVIKVYYVKRSDLSYIVHYKEQGSNTTLAEDKAVNNKTFLEEVTENAIDISGYNKVNPTTQTITIQASGNEMIFYYTKRTDLSYTVHCKEQGSNTTLAEDKVVNNKTYLEEVTENAIDISGYDKVNPTTQTITMQVSGNEMTFYYTKRTDLSYTVHYKEQGSNATLAEDKVVNNKTYLEEVTENAIDINGYNKVNPTTQTITIQPENNEITFYYTKRTDLSYTVHYKEQGSNTTLAEDKVVNNKTYLEEVTENAIDISGYDKVNPTTQTITMQVSGNEMTFYYTKRTDLSYTVHYKEQGSNATLAEDKVVNNKTFLEEVTDNAIDISGYDKVNPTTQTITMQVSGNEMTFLYTKRTDLSYTVHYKEQGSNATLSEDKVVNNKTYLEEVTENAIDINGYNKVNPTTQTITMQVSGNEMIFYYTKRTDLSYTVHYKEQGSNATLSEDKVVNNKTFLEEVTENAIDINGYDKVNPTTQSLTIQVSGNEITFYYTKRGDLSYTIHYKEEGSNATLAEDKFRNNQVYGNIVNESPIIIDGYDMVDPGTIQIQITTGVNEHTFYYTKRTDLNYTVYYKEQGTNQELAEEKFVDNKTYLEEVTENAIDINGYNKVNPTTQTITMQVSGNEMTFFYTKRTDLSYTVHYKEQGSNETLSEDKVVNNKTYLEEVTENAIDINGYNKVNPITQTITIQTSGNEMTFYYTKRTDLSYTVHYKEQGSNETLSEDKVVNNKTYLEEVTENAIDINGYNKVNPTTQTITIQVSGNEMTFFYTKRTDLSYTVHYKEQDLNTTLAEDKVVNNKTYLEEVTENAIDINGYDKVAPTTQTITMQVSGNEITFYYTKRGDLSYTIHYKEEGSNATLAEDKVKDNQVFGNVVDESPIVIDGYDIVDPGTIQIEITTGVNEHTFYYTKRTDLNYTVHYKEQGTNQELAEDKFVDNKTFLDEITENAIEINGYNKVNPTTQTITIQTSDNEITFYYTKRTDLSYTVHYKEQDTEATLSPNKIVNNKTYLEEITEQAIDIDGYSKVDPTSQTIIIQVSGNEITFYYTKRTDLSYTIHYKEQGTNRPVAEDKVVDNQVFGTTTNESAIDINGYRKLEPTSADIAITSGTNEYTFYYEKDNYNYIVEYYYNNIKDDSKTDIIEALYNNEITEYEQKPKIGYKLDRVEGLPLTITANEETNLIKVFYKIDEEQRKDLHYTVVYFKDNILIPEDTVERTESVQVLQDDLIRVDESLYTDEDKYYGYMINTTKPSKVPDKVEDGTIIHVYYIPDPSQTKELKYTVEYYKDGILVVDDTQRETESVQILQPDLITVHKEKINTSNKYENYVLDYTKPENIPDQVVTNSIIKIYYVRRSDLQYTIHYKEQDTDKTLADDKIVTNQTFEDIVEESAIDINGYDKVNPTSTEVEITAGDNEYTFYYTKGKFNYTVEYYYDDIKDDLKTDIIEATYQDEITTYIEKAEGDYKLVDVIGLPLTISYNEDENIIKVYYIKNKYPYTIEYYYNNVKDDSETESGQAYKDDIIDTYTNKNKDGYEFESVEGLPLVISSTEDNIVKVYYLSLRKITINHIDKNTNEIIKTEEKTGKDGYSITTKAEDFEGYICVEKPDTEEYTYSENEQVVNYYYAKQSSGVIVKYIDLISGKLVADDVHYEGFEGKAYTTDIKDIENYKHASNKQYYKAIIEKDSSYLDGSDASTVDEYLEKQGIDGSEDYIPQNHAGKMAQSVIEVKYYYVPNTKLIVKYIDILTGKEIIEPLEEDINLDEEYTTSMEKLDKYIPITNKTYYKNYFNNHPDELKEETIEEYMTKNNIDPDAIYKPENSKGTMEVTINPDDTYSNETVVTYYYSKEREVVIKYYDIISGKEISKEVVKVGPDGEPYDISDAKKEIDGYTIVEIPESQSGIYQEHNETRKYYYAKNTQVIVKYVDKETGKEIAKIQTIDGYVGKGYTTQKENIDGYNYISSTDNISGKMSEEPIEVIYYYSKPIVKTYSSYIINYLDSETGKPINNPKEIKDQELGSIIYAKALIIDIDNYTFDHFDKDSIIIEESDNTINLYYNKNKIEEPKTEEQEQPKQELKNETKPKTESNNKVVPQIKNIEIVKVKNTHKSNLPIYVLGLISIAIGSVITIIGKKKNTIDDKNS